MPARSNCLKTRQRRKPADSDSVMNQYLDAAIKAARAAGALVREHFGRPLKVNVEEAHEIKLELDVRSQTLITDYQGTRAPINYPQRQSSTMSAPRSPKSLISRRMAKSRCPEGHRAHPLAN